MLLLRATVHLERQDDLRRREEVRREAWRRGEERGVEKSVE